MPVSSLINFATSCIKQHMPKNDLHGIFTKNKNSINALDVYNMSIMNYENKFTIFCFNISLSHNTAPFALAKLIAELGK